MDKKDYLYYLWQNNNEDWLQEFAYLAKDKALKGVTNRGITDCKKLVNLADFNLEELMCTQDIIKSKFFSPSKGYNKFNEDYSSYALKHLVEELLIKITRNRINSISNGILILAMHHCGFKFQRIPGTPNCYFNVPKKCYKRMKDALYN